MSKPKGRPPGTTGRAAALSDKEVARAFRAARAINDDGRAEAILALSVGLGLRAGEIAGLLWWDVVDQDGRVRDALVVRGGRVTRSVPITSRTVRAVLADLYHRQGYPIDAIADASVFGTRSDAINGSMISKVISRIYRSAGIAGASSRSGRRTIEERLARLSVDVLSVIRKG